ncbi:peptidase S8/S53 domain-containing protein [Cercophora newfieldiana]|uniref:Peptidase S8/S53 domain-containing protein n=1 Tax=Cercophora newfieldiana TaxID=92897 RepID=A0AA39Y218_9PEZI|nr:peptidase S8/S53 domain-containing protein [Cercophora newfieldiana]
MSAETEARIVPGQWIVRLKQNASSNSQARHMSFVSTRTADPTPFNCEVHHEFDLDEARAYSASFDDATKEELEKTSEVESVEPVQLYRHVSVKTQDKVPWGLGRISSGAKLPASGPYRYKYNDTSSGKGVIAYVIDTGINENHVSFAGRATKGPKFVTDPVPGTTTDDNDNQGHGTHCAGTIGSKDYGVAKDVEIVGIKVFNDLPETNRFAGATNADIMAALDYVVKEFQRHKQPSVVNLSLGGGISDALDNTVAAAVRAGVVVCCAAGNAGPPTWSPKDASTTSPARTGLAVTVAASDVTDTLADFSYYGKLVDVIAPGVDILSTWIGPNNTETNTISGTSMACPHVAGVVSSILSDPKVVDKTPFNVISELLILSDKNKIGLAPTPTPNRGKTVNALAQAPL